MHKKNSCRVGIEEIVGSHWDASVVAAACTIAFAYLVMEWEAERSKADIMRSVNHQRNGLTNTCERALLTGKCGFTF